MPTNEVEVPVIDSRHVERIYATHNSFGTGRPRFDSTMLQARTLKRQDTTLSKIWFAKELVVLAMVYRKMMRSHSIIFVIHNLNNFEDCKVERQEQMAFVQYYNILPNTEVPTDTVDAKIHGMRVKWGRHGCENGGHERCKVFTSCQMESIRGNVHVVPVNLFL